MGHTSIPLLESIFLIASLFMSGVVMCLWSEIFTIMVVGNRIDILLILVISTWTWISCAHLWWFLIKKRMRDVPASVMIVLGSGGHSTEMIRYILPALNRVIFNRRIYIYSKNDLLSRQTASTSEAQSLEPKVKCYFDSISRARNVGQSWLTSVFTTLRACLDALWLILKWKPDLVLCNGPGVCVPIALVARVFGFLGVKRIEVVFFESFCRYETLSLTGYIMRFVSHKCVVPSAKLAKKYGLECLETETEEGSRSSSLI